MLVLRSSHLLIFALSVSIQSCASGKRNGRTTLPEKEVIIAKNPDSMASLKQESRLMNSFSRLYIIRKDAAQHLKFHGLSKQGLSSSIYAFVSSAGSLPVKIISETMDFFWPSVKKSGPIGQKKLLENSPPPKKPHPDSRIYSAPFETIFKELSDRDGGIRVLETSTLDAVVLPREKRALVLIPKTQGEAIGPQEIGEFRILGEDPERRVFLQVIAEDPTSTLLIAQRWEDTVSRHFPINMAISKEDLPLGETLGEGGHAKVYQLGNDALKSRVNPKEILTTLRLQHLDGVVKLKRFFKTAEGPLMGVFEKLQANSFQSFGTMTQEAFRRASHDLASTVKSIKDLDLKHGDISPTNIMMRGNKPVLIDISPGWTPDIPTRRETQDHSLDHL